MRTFVFLMLLSTPLMAVKIDPNAKSFDNHQRKHYVEVYDFDGEFPNLENINIDARRKKAVELNLTGDYPTLKSITYDGTFGTCEGMLTGNFPNLTKAKFRVTSSEMTFDLRGEWKKNCTFEMTGTSEDIVIQLPQDIGLIIHTKTSGSGKVIPADFLKKQNRFGILNKTFHNKSAEDADVVLTLNLEVTSGRIILQ